MIKKPKGILWFYKNREFIKKDDGNYLLNCDFCLQSRVVVNKNFHIRNRNKVKFWTGKDSEKKLVCLPCLFEWKEVEIEPTKKYVFKTYRNRYFKEQLLNDHGSN